MHKNTRLEFVLSPLSPCFFCAFYLYNMSYRQKYLKLTGLYLDRKTHVHHLDFDKTNNDITNLVHLDAKTHIGYHRIITVVNNALISLDMNNDDIDVLTSNWKRGFYIPAGISGKWWEKLDELEIKILNNISIRNRNLGINNIPILVNNKQRKLINMYRKYEK